MSQVKDTAEKSAEAVSSTAQKVEEKTEGGFWNGVKSVGRSAGNAMFGTRTRTGVTVGASVAAAAVTIAEMNGTKVLPRFGRDDHEEMATGAAAFID